MSSGKVHTHACIALAAGFTLASITVGDGSDAQYAIGALTGILVSPDCDVDNGFIAYKYIKQRLGVPAEKIWGWVWYMYRRSLKHGGELSHFPVISTLGRMAYLFFFLIALPYLALLIFFPFDIQYELFWWLAKIAVYWKVVVGLMSADFIHWVLDIATKDGKFDLDSLLRLRPIGRNARSRTPRGLFSFFRRNP